MSPRLSLFFLFALFVSMSGCQSTAPISTEETLPIEDTDSTSTIEMSLLESDFKPTEGALDLAGEGSWKKRILLATSEDGLIFTRTETVIADQANVPNMVVDDQGWIYLYYSGHTVGEKENVSAVAISSDNGETWVHKYLNIWDGDLFIEGNDPDVELLEDGTFRIFFLSKSILSEDIKIYYAEGTDGVNFDFGGVAFEREGPAIDSSTFRIGDEWHQFSLLGNTMHHFHATSEDGKTFTFLSQEDFNFEDRPYVMSNEIQTDSGVRFYAFSPGYADFASYTSTDGITWTLEDGVPLSFEGNSELESKYIMDPAVAQLADGTYLMAYVTVIPS
jgi:hypothetical protein